MRLLIKFPTRARKDKFFSVLKIYRELLSGNHQVHFMINMDVDDTIMNSELIRKQLDEYDNLSYYYSENKTKIQAVNSDLEKYTDWDIVLLASDDMIPQIKSYDDVIINQMKNNFPDTDGILFFNDGYQQNKLNTLCILGKKYYERFGYIYNPEYKSCWSDNEFMEVGFRLNKQIYIPQVIIKHEHPDWGFGGSDYVHKQNQINYQYDYAVFQKNKKN